MDSLMDPAGSSPIVAAVDWLQGTLLGTVATTVAIIAVASVGYGMLTGRVDWRYGARVVVGCFVLFGASSIVAGLRSTVNAMPPTESLEETYSYHQQPTAPLVIPNLPPPPARPAYNPFAGAAAPER